MYVEDKKSLVETRFTDPHVPEGYVYMYKATRQVVSSVSFSPAREVFLPGLHPLLHVELVPNPNPFFVLLAPRFLLASLALRPTKVTSPAEVEETGLQLAGDSTIRCCYAAHPTNQPPS